MSLTNGALAPTETAPPPVLDNDQRFELLLQQMRAQTEAMLKLTQTILEERDRSPWMSEAVAATYIGLDPDKGITARKLRWLQNEGHLLTVQETRPRMYLREEVEEVNEKIKDGRIPYIGYV